MARPHAIRFAYSDDSLADIAMLRSAFAARDLPARSDIATDGHQAAAYLSA
jgi:hypothetical protein